MTSLESLHKQNQIFAHVRPSPVFEVTPCYLPRHTLCFPYRSTDLWNFTSLMQWMLQSQPNPFIRLVCQNSYCFINVAPARWITRIKPPSWHCFLEVSLPLLPGSFMQLQIDKIQGWPELFYLHLPLSDVLWGRERKRHSCEAEDLLGPVASCNHFKRTNNHFFKNRLTVCV